jgi:hypothetical protein
MLVHAHAERDLGRKRQHAAQRYLLLDPQLEFVSLGVTQHKEFSPFFGL